MKYPRQGSEDVSLVICGEAGQGIKTVEEILVKVLKRSGYHVFSIKEYESRIRGGSNSTSIRIGSGRIRAPVKRADIIIPLSEGAVKHLEWRLDSNTTIIQDPDLAGEIDERISANVVKVGIKKTSKEVGGRIYINIIVAGLICGIFGVEKEEFSRVLKEKFSGKGESALEKNIKAQDAGFEMAGTLKGDEKLKINMERNEKVRDEMIMKGVNSISLGAVAGGCDMISSYPMSPSTGVLVDLAARQKRYSIIAEQAEDEISAINMALGAWYAGGRAMVTTSGGGFALMSEGMSLSGITELPVVAHIAQRPGPGTGLPTRTEQGDLNLALHSGHGDFPRAIYAPSDIEEGFALARKAFDTADRFQVPALILTDQFFVDSFYNLEKLEIPRDPPERHVVITEKEYRRYELTDDGVSPRGIPGEGEGLVKVDSDEHDEYGHITESMEVRKQMVDKRMRKMELLEEDVIPPKLQGDGKGTVVLCWGSTLHTVEESVSGIEENISILHPGQVYPLSNELSKILKNADRIICVENNTTGQLASLIGTDLGIRIENRILKYDGSPFTVEELTDQLTEIIRGGGQ